jgi:small subunit ribosomal protein S20
MPNIKGAGKRHRQSLVRREKNRAVKSAIKTQLKKVVAAVQAGVSGAGDKAQSQAEVRLAQKRLDQAAAKGVIHKNKASRLKSRLSKRVKALAAAK